MNKSAYTYIIGLSLFLFGYGASAVMHRVAAQGTLGEPVAPAIITLFSFVIGTACIWLIDKKQSKIE